jgi:hypothetical protein
MATVLTATPNPVPISIWSFTQQGLTTIAWDTGDPRGLGTLVVAVDGGAFGPVRDGAGNPLAAARAGSVGQHIALGKKYVFALRDIGGATLASVAVEAKEALGLPGGMIDDIRNRMSLIQGITNLRVFPGVESVRLMFRTRQPTVPVIDIKRNADLSLAGSAFPFLQGAQSAHDYAFPLEQGTDFTFHILAAPGAGAFSSAKAVTATGQFRTGLRSATVFFDHVFVHTDGDPGSLGDGDFTFDMGAGDIETEAMLGAVQMVAEISGGDDRAIGQSVPITSAPTGLWVQVRAEEDDSFFTPFGGDPMVGFAPAGSTWSHQDEFGESETATVTQWFDLSGAGPIPQEIPFTLETGPKHIDFSLTGRVRMEATPGANLQPMVTRSARPTARVRAVATLAAGDRIVVGSHVVQLAADGSLYHAAARDRATARTRPAGLQWTRVDGAVRAPVTIASDATALHVLAVNDAGAVAHLRIAADSRAAARWEALGGKVVPPVVAVPAGDGIELFALDGEGAVLHRSLTGAAPRDWRQIGDGGHGSLAAFTTPRGERGLVALGRGGDLLHLPWSTDPAHAGAAQWRPLGRAPAGALAAEWIDDAVVLAVLADDETVHAAAWRNYPEPARLEWRTFGTLNELVSARYSLRQGG